MQQLPMSCCNALHVAVSGEKITSQQYSQTACCLYKMQMLSMIAQSSEFENMAVREEELPELDQLLTDACPFDARGGPENKQGKVCILIQVCVKTTADMFSTFKKVTELARPFTECRLIALPWLRVRLTLCCNCVMHTRNRHLFLGRGWIASR
jgi:Sec63 Brl domain